jgi:hypothetical protein
MSESRTLTGQWPVADGQRPRWSAIVRRLELVALVPTLAWVLLAQLSWWPVPPTNDFGKFYYGARLWLQGDSMYGPSRATWVTLEQGFGLQLWNLNPPHFQLLILPLTSVTPGAAYFIWAGVNFLAGMIALHWIVTTLEWRLPTGRRRVWLLAALLSAAPTWATAATGQFMGLLLLLMTWVWREWRAQRWERAAIGIGIACSMKLFFAPLIGYLLVTRRWRAAGVALASCAACFGVGLLAFGWSEYVAWGRVLTEVSWPWFPMNTSIVAPFTRYAYTEQAWWYQGLPDTRSAMQIGMLVAAPLALLGGLVAWRDRNHQRAARAAQHNPADVPHRVGLLLVDVGRPDRRPLASVGRTPGGVEAVAGGLPAILVVLADRFSDLGVHDRVRVHVGPARLLDRTDSKFMARRVMLDQRLSPRLAAVVIALFVVLWSLAVWYLPGLFA